MGCWEDQHGEPDLLAALTAILLEGVEGHPVLVMLGRPACSVEVEGAEEGTTLLRMAAANQFSVAEAEGGPLT